MNYVFIDTNVFLHFVHFEQINWRSIIEKEGDITIVVAPTVIDELDKHKYNQNKKISKRAKKLLPQIEALIDGTQKSKYPLLYVTEKPADETLAKYNLAKGDQDDLILATVLEFTNSHASDAIALVTNDVGPRLKAKANGIAAFKIPDEYLLQPEIDEAEKEAIELRKEVAALKNRLPVLRVIFADGAELLSVGARPKLLSREKFVEKQMEQIKKEHSRLYHYPRGEYRNPLLDVVANSFTTLSQEQVERYNKELEKFYGDYEEYAKSFYQLYVVKYNSVEINLILKNEGTAPAKDIDVHLHFPDGFELVEKSNLPKIRKKPEPPYKPQHRLDLNFRLAASIINPVVPNHSSNPLKTEVNASKPVIRKTNGYEADFHVKNIKHHYGVGLSVLYVKFENINAATGFRFDYRLIAADLPNIVTGQLSVKFEKD